MTGRHGPGPRLLPRPPAKGGLAASVAGQMAARSPQTFHIGTGAEAADLGFLAAQPAVLSLTHFHQESSLTCPSAARERVHSALAYRHLFARRAEAQFVELVGVVTLGFFVTTNR